MTQGTLTSEVLLAVLWLGATTPDGSVVPAGSGVVVHHQGCEYLATACHVAEDCNFSPWVRKDNQWSEREWDIVGVDEQCDVAVLRTSTAKLSHLTPNYGFGNVLVGGVGRALGFPAISDPRDMSHVAQVGGAPIPLGVLVASYFIPPTEASVHYLGGYANSGFSGGAVVLPTIQGAWTIAGIITHREGVPKGTIYGKDAETGRWVLRDDLCLQEPSGVIKFAGFGVVTNLIEGVATVG